MKAHKRLSAIFCLLFVFHDHAEAIEEYSSTNTCVLGGSTHMCSESSTKIEHLLEAWVYSGGEVRVNATFTGPDYYVQLNIGKPVSVFFPSSWEAKASLAPWRCAYGGSHSAEGLHSAHGMNEGLPFPTCGPVQTFDSYLRYYCDCPGEIP